jgi:hypothetical protein
MIWLISEWRLQAHKTEDILDNKEPLNKYKIYCWKGYCFRCFNKIEYPLLGSSSYGEDLFQTTDGKDFYYTRYLDSVVLDDVENVLRNKKYELRKILIQLADKPRDKSFTMKNALCPICARRLWVTPVDNVRGSQKKLDIVTWNGYLSKDMQEKTKVIIEAYNRNK